MKFRLKSFKSLTIVHNHENPVDSSITMCLQATGVNSSSFLVATFLSLMISCADPKCPSRYHCTHEAGVHSVGLTWIHKLHKFLGSGKFINTVYFPVYFRGSDKS